MIMKYLRIVEQKREEIPKEEIPKINERIKRIFFFKLGRLSENFENISWIGLN